MGKKVYLDDGCEALLVTTTEDNKYIVRRTIEVDYDGDQTDSYPSEMVEQVSHVHEKPPSQGYDNKIAQLRDMIDALHKEEQKLRDQVSNYKLEQSELLKRAETNDAIKYVFDILDGKITHFVIPRSNSISIVSFTDALKADNVWRHQGDLRLLTLTGTSNDNTAWQINGYRDGSGHDEKVVPCHSYDEALEIAQASLTKSALDAVADCKRTGNYYTHGFDSISGVALEYGLDLPEEFVAMDKMYKDKLKKEHIESLKRKLIEAESEEP